MNGGRIEQEGTPREVFGMPASAFTARFLGFPNALVGELQGVQDGVAKVGLPCGSSFQALWRGHDPRPGRAVTIAFRADRVAFTPDRPVGAGNVMSASVATASFLGTVMDYTVIAGGCELKAEGPPEQPAEHGMHGFITVAREHCHAFES